MDGLKRLDDRVSVAPQLAAGDMARLAAAGVRLVVCNRPDGEALFGQPSARRLAEAASAHGIAWLDLPFSGVDATDGQARAFAAAVDEADGPVVAFCRIGFRSALLWAMAEATRGADPDAAILAARAAGFDLAPQYDRIAACAPRRADGGGA